MDKIELRQYREFLKDNLRQTINFHLTDQHQGLKPPPLQKSPLGNQQRVPLPKADGFQEFSGTDLIAAIANRRSHRHFQDQPLSLGELAFLLWATQGCKGILGPGTALRTVPSAGCRHPFETYLAVTNVKDLQPGLYRYLPFDEELVLEQKIEPTTLQMSLAQGTLGQSFTATAPATFIWSVIPRRSEWRYHTAAHRVILMDVGHLCQNLYLAVAAIGCGTCAIAAFNQPGMDKLIDVDGEEEFVIYLAPVGKI